MDEIKSVEDALAWCRAHDATVHFRGGRVTVYDENDTWLGQAATFVGAVDAAALEWYDQAQELAESIKEDGPSGQ